MRRFVYFCVGALICLACEDTKSSQKTTRAPQELDTVSVDTSSVVEEVEKPPLGTPKNPFMPTQYEVKPFLKTYGEENPETKVRIETSFGDIEVELFKDTPLHRANFILMAKEGYFDLTQFYRVSPAFVIQGGNSDSYKMTKKRRAMGDYLLPNEAKPHHRHVRGALAAAKFVEQNISNASSPFEFYIVQPQRGAHHLNKAHTVFGRVTKGMDVVDEINKVPVDQSEWPLNNIPMKVTVLE
ncbi:MAG: peptidylprolyl isomerase [Dokdonia sp.]